MEASGEARAASVGASGVSVATASGDLEQAEASTVSVGASGVSVATSSTEGTSSQSTSVAVTTESAERTTPAAGMGLVLFEVPADAPSLVYVGSWQTVVVEGSASVELRPGTYKLKIRDIDDRATWHKAKVDVVADGTVRVRWSREDAPVVSTGE